MDKPYPKILKTKEDIEFVVNNFPEEVWRNDILELYSLSRGYHVLGTNPVYKDIDVNGKPVKTLAGYEPIDEEERADVELHDYLWENATGDGETDVAEFDYKGKHYYAEFRVLDDSVVGMTGVDVEWLEDILFGKKEYERTLKKLDELQDMINAD